MSFAIRVDNLGKRYRLGATHAGSIRELVNRSWRRLRGHSEQLLPHEHAQLQSLVGGKLEEDGSFWALRDVSFEVQPGEVVGIIGRNGSGKSTLLKILSQITAPTTGRVELNGRVASLLEVGTGFHPELSGRENVFLNGAILGMTKTEIRRKFDEIVAFAEIEKFIDTPVKRYSSGMYVRLAFAVAAHLEPEILVVDEVLAVGDLAFQKKCIQKMEDVAMEGRAVLVVSHNITTIMRLCTRGVLLENGVAVLDDDAKTVGAHYQKNRLVSCTERLWMEGEAPGNAVVRLLGVRVVNKQRKAIHYVPVTETFGLEMTYEVKEANAILTPNVHVYNSEGLCLFVTIDTNPEWHRKRRTPGIYKSAFWVPPNFLNESDLLMDIAITTLDSMKIHIHEREIVGIQVTDIPENPYTRGAYHGGMPGLFAPSFIGKPSITAPRSMRSVDDDSDAQCD